MFCGQSSSSSFGDNFSCTEVDKLDYTIMVKKNVFEIVSVGCLLQIAVLTFGFDITVNHPSIMEICKTFQQL